ncbi:MAG: Rossmann-like and DUF2520 domain-containing protein [Desulfobacterales bacterium]
MKPSFTIIGCGRVGIALAKYLVKYGYISAGLASKSLASAKRVANLIGSSCFSNILWEASKKADIVFITTPDGVIKSVCDSISEMNGFKSGSVVLHCSGALSSKELISAKNCGAYTGSMHPLQSFASTEYEFNPFSGIVTSVEGDREAVDAAKHVTEDLGSHCVTIKTEEKMLYHASAVVASNYLVTLLDLSLNLIKLAGVTGEDALRGLKPLIEGTISNVEKMGVQNALTGPIARGDILTIEKHLSEIGSKAPGLLSLYRTLGIHTVEIARLKGSISEAALKRLEDLFRE